VRHYVYEGASQYIERVFLKWFVLPDMVNYRPFIKQVAPVANTFSLVVVNMLILQYRFIPLSLYRLTVDHHTALRYCFSAGLGV
jgi:hypothetical protein